MLKETYEKRRCFIAKENNKNTRSFDDVKPFSDHLAFVIDDDGRVEGEG